MGELENVDQSRIDKLIWKHAGLKPVREIAELAGIRPEEVLRRKNELLEEVDVLTIQQKRQRLMIELDGMARDARDRAEGISSEFYAGTINAATGAIKTLLGELNRLEKQDTTRLESLNQKRIAELVSLVREVVDISVLEIAEQHDLDQEELYAVFNQRMIEAAQKRDLS